MTMPQTADVEHAARVFVGDEALASERVAGVLARSRGLAYGDGVFETMRAHRGTIHWWPAHWARAARGAERLGIPPPSRARVEAECDALLREAPDAVVKWMLLRGTGARGYAPDPAAPPLWLLSAHPAPMPLARGLRLRWCETRLAAQPLLAGIKHCNRLEQVLARAEWARLDVDEAACDDGLMRDADGRAVAATSANLFVHRDGGWLTPSVERCGIAGVCRAWAMEALDAREVDLSVEAVESADALVLCNAVRGILPVARLGDARWPSRHPAANEAIRRLAAAHPAFADAPMAEAPNDANVDNDDNAQ
ncbi:MAG: aminodeoxychorismate lyase [Xanthomonadaceae bacterium]|nr:aminodeoxychorismate lyase [Xanthomonadaceae bacterium]